VNRRCIPEDDYSSSTRWLAGVRGELVELLVLVLGDLALVLEPDGLDSVDPGAVKMLFDAG